MSGVYDVIGLGFGPANLALAIALSERPAGRAVFLERQESFGWHRGLLLPGATMQVSFLKDLVTLRNPASRFSFVSYLHEHGRLTDFINQGRNYPARTEFHDYLTWVAAEFEDQVEYGAEVVDVRPVADETEVSHWDVVARRGTGAEVVHRTRNLVLAGGLTPRLPEGVAGSARVWHGGELLHRIAEVPERPGLRFAVVGAGQSAAEITAYLHDHYSRAKVYAIMSRYGYSRADDSAFANRVFDPGAVDDFFHAPPEVVRRLYAYHGNTNYSVVDDDLISELHRRYYQEKVSGRPRLRLVNLAEVTGADPAPDHVTLKIQSLTTGVMTDLDVDVVIYATGFEPMDPLRLLGSAAAHCRLDETGRVRVTRDYRVVTAPAVSAGVYLQGGTEHTHGVSASLLSTVAVRAGEIAGSLAAPVTRPATACPAARARSRSDPPW